MKYDYSSLQTDLPPDLAAAVLAAGQRLVKETDLGEDGRETSPHVTILFGFSELRPSKALRRLIAETAPFDAVLGPTAVFENDQDVLYFKVESQPLMWLNARVNRLPNHSTYPVYKPHVCIAYLKKGAAAGLAGNDAMTGRRWKVSQVVFSGAGGDKEIMRLGG